MNRRDALIALAGAASLVPGVLLSGARPVWAQTPEAPEAYRASVLTVGGFSLRSSQLALDKAANAGVRNFAQLEVEEQIATAAALGAQPEAVPIRESDAAILAQLQAADGAAFDAMYLQGQIAGHEELLRINQAYAKVGADPVGQAVAILAVPAIHTHLGILAGLRRA